MHWDFVICAGVGLVAGIGLCLAWWYWQSHRKL
jgi:hypothetical protein